MLALRKAGKTVYMINRQISISGSRTYDSVSQDRPMAFEPRRHRPLRRRNPILDWMLTLLFFAGLAFAIARYAQIESISHQGRAVIADGDTIELAGQRIRLEGIDAPEYNQICQGKSGPFNCGREARRKLAALAGTGPVRCTGWQEDKYGRLLGTCTSGRTDLNREMVASGWAVSYGQYAAEETAARKASAGLWQGEFQRPADWRKAHEATLAAQDSPHDFWHQLSALLKRIFGIE
jgi:endonuclease YncB( thermonuclease family)